MQDFQQNKEFINMLFLIELVFLPFIKIEVGILEKN